MLCRNEFCIYQEKGHCLLTEITLDENGMCEDCIYVEPDPAALGKAKKELRTALDRRVEKLGED